MRWSYIMAKIMIFLFPFELVELFTHCLSSCSFHVRLIRLVSRFHNLLLCWYIVFSLDLYCIVNWTIIKSRKGASVIWLKISISFPFAGNFILNITYIIWTLKINSNLCDFPIISTLWEFKFIFKVLLAWMCSK